MIKERIVKKNEKYFVVSEDGKRNLGGPFESREQAVKRLQQVEHFKKQEKLVFGVQDYKCELIEAEGKVTGLKMFGTALKEGISRNKRNYTIEHLKDNDGESFNFIVGHRQDYDNPDHNVGEGKYTLNGDKLDFEGKVFNNFHHPDIVEQIHPKNLVSVSIQGGFTDVSVKDGKIAFEGLRIPILALVNKHTRGVEAASIEAVIAERLEQEDEEASKMSDEFEVKLQEKEVEITKLKEAMHNKEEDMKKMQKDMSDKEKEEMNKKKKKITESLISLNKELKEEELMEKSLSELELMEQYEKKLKESQNEDEDDESLSEVQDIFKPGETDGIVIEKVTGNITMSESARLKFNDEIMKSIYR